MALDDVLERAKDLDALSFYGLSKTLEKIDELLAQGDDALLLKNRTSAQQDVIDHKDELLEAQGQVRRGMGQRLEKPELTKREVPLAEGFLAMQLSRLSRGDTSNERVQKGISRLKEVQEALRSTPPRHENAAVKQMEKSIQQMEAEWKEVQPLYAKWEAGRHSFKSNDELQAFKRRYEACRKGREGGGPKLEELLCKAFDAKSAEALARREEEAERLRREGWAGVAKKAPPTTKAGVRKPIAKRPSAPSAWNSGEGVNMAQRMRAEAAAKVRMEAEEESKENEEEGADEDSVEEEEEAEDDGGFWEEPEKAPAPVSLPKAKGGKSAAAAPSVVPKAAPAGVAAAKAAPPPVPEKNGQRNGKADDSSVPSIGNTSKANKRKKDKGPSAKGGVDPLQPEDAEPRSSRPAALSVALSAMEMLLQGSLLQALLRPSSWSSPEDDDGAGCRLDELRAAVTLANPLGLQLQWKDFTELEMDFGPKPTSKRGDSPGLARLRTNLPASLPCYVTATFFFVLLCELSTFGLIFWGSACQVALLLMPVDAVKQLPPHAKALVLQVVHLLLWLLFIRALWLMHFFVKVFVVMLICGHAYIVAPKPADD
eukprot:TRINITY_DN81228_c0_g1_i1.p1 TRINITY_DN81228_c0_g1~~TRINITY_DN81228_c0_g1_i1.p1  ORF type:complete len:598 (-),score=180.58 TRINITY_DN81228_c0_g1_i1:30-1823(-)